MGSQSKRTTSFPPFEVGVKFFASAGRSSFCTRAGTGTQAGTALRRNVELDVFVNRKLGLGVVLDEVLGTELVCQLTKYPVERRDVLRRVACVQVLVLQRCRQEFRQERRAAGLVGKSRHTDLCSFADRVELVILARRV